MHYFSRTKHRPCKPPTILRHKYRGTFSSLLFCQKKKLSSFRSRISLAKEGRASLNQSHPKVGRQSAAQGITCIVAFKAGNFSQTTAPSTSSFPPSRGRGDIPDTPSEKKEPKERVEGRVKRGQKWGYDFICQPTSQCHFFSTLSQIGFFMWASILLATITVSGQVIIPVYEKP